MDKSGGWRGPVAIAAVALLLLVPVLVMDHALSADAPVHILWQAHFAHAVWRGDLYPRWLSDMNLGFGSPAFFFYPPLMQWAGAAFAPVLPGGHHALHRLVLGCWLLSCLGAVGCSRWLRALDVSPAAALVGALAFLLMPYRCFVDVYQRGALAEMVGICFMPWAMAGASLLYRGRPGGFAMLALATGGLLFTHLPSAVIGSLMIAGYCAALALGGNWRAGGRAMAAVALGYMIGAASLVPALGLLGFLTDTTAMWGARNQPVNWLLFAPRSWVDSSVHAMTLGLLCLGLALCGLLFAWIHAGTRPLHRRIALILTVAVVLVAVFNTELSRPFWALQTPVSRIQFPFRLQAVHVVALSGLIGLAVDTGRGARFHRATLLLGGLLLVDVSCLAYQRYHHRHDRQIETAITASTVDTSEYVLAPLNLANARFASQSVIPLDGRQGPLAAQVTAWQGRRLVLDVTAQRPGPVAIRHFAFTGWQCRVDDGAWQAPIGPAQGSYPACNLPAGAHRLTLYLAATPPEKVGWMLTGTGLLAVFACLIVSRRQPVVRRVA